MDILAEIRGAITGALPGAKVTASGGGGHFAIEVVAAEFAGRTMLEQQRLVYRAISPLMTGISAPVHAIDSLVTKAP
jgi:acid stress-induced BolA-like protein IbaG/YrbA